MDLRSKSVHLLSFLLVLLSLTAISEVLFAQGKGKIAGRVFDVEANEPLPGANIVIENTFMGAAADHSGEYFILNVAPGEFTVAASMIGYETLIKLKVLVEAGVSSHIDFPMKQAAFEGAEITVIAERPVVKVDVASSETTLQGTEIAAIPVSNFKDVLDKQLGIRDVDARGLFMRGQRQSAISLTIDGFETRDNIDDMVYTRFNPDELEQVGISASGYEASIGNATAGVISLVSKEGGNKYNMTFDYRQSTLSRKHFGPPLKHYWNEFYLEGWENSFVKATWKPALTGNPNDTLATLWEAKAHQVSRSSPVRDRPNLLKELYIYRMRDEVTDYGNKPDGVLNATFGGPVPFLKNATFFTSYRREKNYYLYPGVLDHFFDQNAMAKLTFRPTTNIKLSINTRYTQTKGLNRYDYYRYDQSTDLGTTNPDFQSEKRYIYENVEQVAWSGFGSWPYVGWMGQSTRQSNQYGFSFTHTLNPSTFYEVTFQINNFHQVGGMGKVRDTSPTVTLLANRSYPGTQGTGLDTLILSGESALAPADYWPLGLFDDGLEKLTLGGTYGYDENNIAKNTTLKANLISQVNKSNQINIGFQYNYYDIKKNEDRVQGTFRDDNWKWHVKPQSFAFWASDKLEFEGMVLNLGFRGDLRIPDEWLNVRNDPWNYHWSDKVFADSGIVDPTENNMAGPRYQPPLKFALAPRLGISHPIGDYAKIYFNWGHYYQDPPLERQYMYYTRGGSLSGEGWTTFGDPELPFFKAVQYEIGYEHNLLNVFRIGASFYYKDVKNLLTDEIRFHADDSKRVDGLAPHYYTAGANRYITSQGIELRLEKRVGRFWTAWFNYNYEDYSRGLHGFTTFYEDQNQAPEPFNYSSANRDRPGESRFNLGVNIYTPDKFGPRFLGFHPAADISTNILLWWRQQPTFTYNPERLPPPYSPSDNMRWIPHWGVNLTLSKRFDFGSFVTPVFYVEVYNLLDTKNMFRGSFSDQRLSVFEEYITAIKEAGAEPGERPDLAIKAIGNNPENVEHSPITAYVPFGIYLNPRQIWFGIRIEFKEP